MYSQYKYIILISIVLSQIISIDKYYIIVYIGILLSYYLYIYYL